MSRYTLAELNRRPIDAITLATPTAVLEGVENRVFVALCDLDVAYEVHDAVMSIITDARAELDRIEEERG